MDSTNELIKSSTITIISIITFWGLYTNHRIDMIRFIQAGGRPPLNEENISSKILLFIAAYSIFSVFKYVK